MELAAQRVAGEVEVALEDVGGGRRVPVGARVVELVVLIVGGVDRDATR